MKMKTTKFLAVLAVLAMAFAVFAVIAPAESQDADDVTVTDITSTLTIPEGATTGTSYYINMATVGQNATLTVSATTGDFKVYVYGAKGNAYTLSPSATATSVKLYLTASTSVVSDKVTPIDGLEITAAAQAYTADSSAKSISTGTAAATATCGVLYTHGTTVYTYYATGTLADITLASGETAVVKNASVTVKNNSAGTAGSVKFTGDTSEAGITLTGANTNMTIEGTVKAKNTNFITVGGVVKVNTSNLSFGDAPDVPSINAGTDSGHYEGGSIGSGTYLIGADFMNTTTSARYVYNNIDASFGVNAASAINFINSTGKITFKNAAGTETLAVIENEKFTGAVTPTATTWTPIILSTVTSGALTLTSGAYSANETVVAAEATVNVASGATLQVESGDTAKLTVKGAMYVSGTIKSNSTTAAATVLVKDDATLAKDDKSVFKTRVGATMTKINFDSNSRGSVDITTVLNEVGLSGSIESSNTYTASQVVTITNDLRITNHAVIKINGYLVVPTGVTLTIDDGSALVIDGVYSESEINGEIEVTKDSALYIKNAKAFELNGTLTTNASGTNYASLTIASKFTANDGSVLDLAGATFVTTTDVFTVGKGAKADISGPINTGDKAAVKYIKNAGTIVLDGATISKIAANAELGNGFVTVTASGDDQISVLAIKMSGNGAIVDVEEIKFNSISGAEVAYLTVTDAGIKGSSTAEALVDTNTITIQPAVVGIGISGLEIGEKTSTTVNSTDKKTYTKNNMYISGDVARVGATGDQAITVTVTQTNSADTTKTKYKSFSIEDEMVIGKAITLTFDDAKQAFVNGDVEVEDLAYISAPAGNVVTINGSIDSYAALDENGFYKQCVGAYFKADTHSYVITTLPAAMTFAALSEGKVNVTVYNENTVSADMYITSNVKMTGGKIIVAKDVTVTVITGASVGNDFDVKGILIAEVEKNLTGSVTADVKVTDGVGAMWTSLATALATAEAGDIILITNSTLTISDSLTIPAGITVVIPDGTNASIAAKKTLTVNGLLISDATIKMNTDSKLIVNGAARFVGSDVATKYTDYKTEAAYYTDDNYVYITNLAYAIESEVKAISIYGKVSESSSLKAENQTITLVETTDGTVLKVSGLTLGKTASINAAAGKLSGTVSALFDDGSEAAVMALSDFDGTVSCTYSSTTGYTAAIDEITGTVAVVSGTVEITGTTATGTLNVLPSGEFVVPTGKTLTLNKGLNSGIIYVCGTLTISSKDMVNAGIINVVYDEEDSIAGVFNVSAINMSLGTISVDDKATCNINGDLIVGTAAESLNAVASIDGKVNIDNTHYIIAYANADVSEMIVNPNSDGESTAKYTEFYINDMLYMTLIASANNTVKCNTVLQTLTFDIEELDEAQLLELKKATSWGMTADDYIGTYDEVSVELDYRLIDIYASWTKGLTLYIDGVRIMQTDIELSVGAHIITATIDAGYACDNMKITFNGVPVTAAGILLEVSDEDSVIAVSGDVYIPEPEPVTPEEKSEWTITTILLVVLVILIAIMAVIVALRLNRS